MEIHKHWPSSLITKATLPPTDFLDTKFSCIDFCRIPHYTFVLNHIVIHFFPGTGLSFDNKIDCAFVQTSNRDRSWGKSADMIERKAVVEPHTNLVQQNSLKGFVVHKIEEKTCILGDSKIVMY